jgi:hypothetical protein
MLDGGAHQLVVGRVKLHQVDAMAVAVMAAEHRFVRLARNPAAISGPPASAP